MVGARPCRNKRFLGRASAAKTSPGRPEISGIACDSGSYLNPANFVPRSVARATRLAILAARGALALKAFRLTRELYRP